MIIDNPTRPATRALPLPVVLVGIPVIMTLVGLLLRYAGYATAVPEASIAGFADGLCRWDCLWYVRLAEGGYDPFPVPRMIMAGNWAFFPAFPMLVGALRIITGLETTLVATITSIMLANAAVLLAWPLLERNLRAYALYATFILAGPASIYYTTFYTEVLFVLLTTAVFVALKRGHYLAAGVLGALLSATRIVGVFIVFAIVVQALIDHRRAGGSWRGFIPAALRRPDLVLAVFVAPLGLFAYMAYLHFHIGDALAFQHVQVAWARKLDNPLTFLWHGLNRFPAEGWLPTVSQFLALSAIIGLVLSLVLAWRRQFAEAIFCAICIVLPLGAGLASMMRFVTALAPLTILASTLLSRYWPVWAAAMLACLVGGYYAPIGWIREYLLLV